MTESGAFQSLTDFGIALAGFTSIVVVFGRRGGEFHPADRARVFHALAPSLGGAFLALLPVGLDLVGISSSMVWRLSSWVLVAVMGSYVVDTELKARRPNPEVRAVLSSSLLQVVRALRVSSVIAGILNATGLLFSPQPGAYFFAVAAPLRLSAIVFSRMVFVRPVSQ
jgi:hypothetical protein